VDAVVNLQSIFHAGSADRSVQALKSLDVPVFHPLTVYHKSEEEWREDIHGLDSSEVGWSVALPEFEGLIEPILVGASARETMAETEVEKHAGVEDRIQKVARRVKRWIRLREKPAAERRVAFILHNNPCASAEATVGSGSHLDTLESVAGILESMKEAGYRIENQPASGKELIDAIMDRKAISEFRWTPIEEIVSKGGALAMLSKEEYESWFNDLPQSTRQKVCNAWGQPPGEERDGVPAAMVHEGKILITGVRYGNAVVCVQPKRGCAGSRCDGRVCKILHDPDVPPPHQYVATYKWLSREFEADAVIHVGTHGNLEFLPGKAAGLSSGCFPDAAIDEMPHFYLYNADNAPEGTIAKRRSYATLVDHLQAVMVQGEIYGAPREEIERLLFEYEKLKEIEPAKAHTVQHMIEARLHEGNLDSMIKVPADAPFSRVVQAAHEVLSLLKNSYIPRGMHVFGRPPEGERLVEFVYAVVRYDNGPGSLRGEVKRLLEEDPAFAALDEAVKKDLVDKKAREACACHLEEGTPLPEKLAELFPGAELRRDVIDAIQAKIQDVRARVLLSDETGSLLNGLNGGYVPPGPSGIITRGRDDILPTGRNFYSLGPRLVDPRHTRKEPVGGLSEEFRV